MVIRFKQTLLGPCRFSSEKDRCLRSLGELWRREISGGRSWEADEWRWSGGVLER